MSERSWIPVCSCGNKLFISYERDREDLEKKDALVFVCALCDRVWGNEGNQKKEYIDKE